MEALESNYWVSRNGRLQAARAFIENNLTWCELSPATVAQALGISVRQLHLLFEPMGTTFSRYVLARRLERSRVALAGEPDRKVIDIALACGIESSSVFYRSFRDAFGMNPTAYRRALTEVSNCAAWRSPALDSDEARFDRLRH